MSDTPRLDLPEIAAAQAQKHVTHNDALARLDVLVQMTVKSIDQATPPADPIDGQLHIVASGGSGAWAGQDSMIASWRDGGWSFLSPKQGWLCFDQSSEQLVVFDATTWQPYASGGVANQTDQLGISATADDTNRLSVSSPVILHSAVNTGDGGSGDARLIISKEQSANTASVVFQTAFSGRAEFGLTGSDAFALKVSPDDVSWLDALSIDQTTAVADFAQPLMRSGHAIPDAGVSVETSFEDGGLADHLIWFRASDGAPRRITASDLKSALQVSGTGGTAGADGASFFSGNGSPSSSLGQDGDTYLDRVTGALHTRASGAWGATGDSLMGIAGPEGSQGATGATGPTGPQGTPGLSGADGQDGATFAPDAVGLATERSGHDAEAAGFAFLATDTNQIAWKRSATLADWSGWADWGTVSQPIATSGAGSTTPLGMFVAASL